MLFNSYEFLFLFLPVTWLGYVALGKLRWPTAAVAWLSFASLMFYGYWNPNYLALMSASIVFNYTVGNHFILRGGETGRVALLAGIAGNLGLLGYFKYAGLAVSTVNAVGGTEFTVPKIVLPLAISFFTFQQVAYLVDVHRGQVGKTHPLQYALFVTFFPQLIAGPIVHHSEMLPQFGRSILERVNAESFARGVTCFSIGLFKKVLIADTLAPYADALFSAAETRAVASIDAWTGTLAYTFQLYFDFSGYADMAIGAGLLFGIRLPDNFNSPYKAANIIDFWRRWHMTLSRFLRDYLYIPLGGGRRGSGRRYANLIITMLLGGLWHGASWTFVVWGGLHGLYLLINHAWRASLGDAVRGRLGRSWAAQLAARLLTFLAVVLAWVFFRATSFEGALRVIEAMAFVGTRPEFDGQSLWTMAIFALVPLVMVLPNSTYLTERYRPSVAYGVLVFGALAIALPWVVFGGVPTEFLYFDF